MQCLDQIAGASVCILELLLAGAKRQLQLHSETSLRYPASEARLSMI